MRTVWKGSIGLGSFAIPVKAYRATSESGTGLSQVHTTDGGRIQYRRICEVDGAEVPAEEIGKGYATASGEVVVLSDEELASLSGGASESIRIHGFVRRGQIDPLLHAKSYYLEPEVSATKPYVLLCEALLQADRVAVVKVALRQRETLGTLRVVDQVLVLDTLYWPQEVRSPDFPFVHEDVDLRMTQVRAAANLIEQLSGEFEPHRFTDGYPEALSALVEARIEGQDVVRPTEAAQDEGVAELLRMLREHTRQRTGADEDADADTETDQFSARRAAVSRAEAAAGEAKEAGKKARKAASRTRTAPKSRR